MIYLDPDLNAAQSPSRKLNGSAPAAQRTDTRNNRIPSSRALARFLREAQSVVKLQGQVTVLLTSDRAVRRLNRQFRGKDKTTDVLSFAAYSPGPKGEGPEAPADPSQVSKARPGAPKGLRIVGDIAISVDTARRQAGGLGHALAVEIKVLMLHGLLHLAGYDHETDNGEMARREEKLREKLRLPHGLIERAEAAGSRGLSSRTHSAVELRNGWGTKRSDKAGKERRA